tara:strand:+ start:4978 stop:6135 length:1158 start_codon:yes stop_codon:yes gene_type:complete
VSYAKPFGWNLISVAIASFVVAALVFAFVVKLPRTETARGWLRYDEAEARVVPSIVGTLESCPAKNGQRVAAGQVLATIRTEQFLRDGEALSDEEIGGLEHELSILQERIRNANERASINKRIAIEQHENTTRLIQQKRKESDLQQTQSAEISLRLEKAEQDRRDGLTTYYEVYGLRDKLAGLNLAILQSEAEISRLSSEQATAQMKLLQIDADALDEQSRLKQEVAQINSRFTKQEAGNGYSITSPIDGRVTASICRVGEIAVQERTLMIILPLDSRLVGELSLPSTAIAFAKKGQRVRIRYDAFPAATFGTYNGTVSEISLAVSGTPLGTAADQEYRVWIEIDDAVRDKNSNQVPMQSGMQFTADIILEDRRVMDWIVSSIQK